jgi:hypothetical protein
MNLLEIAFGGMMRNTPFLASLPSIGIVKLFSHFEKKLCPVIRQNLIMVKNCCIALRY